MTEPRFDLSNLPDLRGLVELAVVGERILGACSPRTIRRLIAEQKLPAVKVRGTYLARRSDVEAALVRMLDAAGRDRPRSAAAASTSTPPLHPSAAAAAAATAHIHDLARQALDAAIALDGETDPRLVGAARCLRLLADQAAQFQPPQPRRT